LFSCQLTIHRGGVVRLRRARRVTDAHLLGPTSWSRFTASPLDSLWYYQQCLAAFTDRRAPVLLVNRLGHQLEHMARLVAPAPDHTAG